MCISFGVRGVDRVWATAHEENAKLPKRAVVGAVGAVALLWDKLFPAEQARIVRLLVERVDVAQDRIVARLRADGLQTPVEQLRTTNASARGMRAS